jgi:hypothetical protein
VRFGRESSAFLKDVPPRILNAPLLRPDFLENAVNFCASPFFEAEIKTYCHPKSISYESSKNQQNSSLKDQSVVCLTLLRKIRLRHSIFIFSVLST